jgi:hypothetical protein
MSQTHWDTRAENYEIHSTKLNFCSNFIPASLLQAIILYSFFPIKYGLKQFQWPRVGIFYESVRKSSGFTDATTLSNILKLYH